eukprot:TRINITY_DN23848_c0_g1_i1.p2 TRINITY_DN23848_c0_g1~~TRINITY_DN23848_c0_g1_i1.p2  ORF type:complete len:344 (-),score=86.63 TRINITY_DN23848_c0_g1_i1:1098-2129(-)
MLVIEVRVPLPVHIDEFDTAQLYCVAKSSKQNTRGEEGVEVLENAPFEKDGSKGQYTHKVLHIGSHLPKWIQKLIPKSLCRFVEESWNAYPFSQTEYKCAFFGEKFTLRNTTIHSANGEEANIHNLPKDLLKKRVIDVMNIATDRVEKKDYRKDEDPTLVHSEKTSIGPLQRGWETGTQPMMWAYKLLTIEFRYKGIQKKVEKTIYKFVRRIFLMYFRQVYCWMDEWKGMSMDDVRAYETQVQTTSLMKGCAANGSEEEIPPSVVIRRLSQAQVGGSSSSPDDDSDEGGTSEDEENNNEGDDDDDDGGGGGGDNGGDNTNTKDKGKGKGNSTAPPPPTHKCSL